MGELVRVRLANKLKCESIVYVPSDCPWDRLTTVISLRLSIDLENEDLKIGHLILVDKNNEELSGYIRDTATLFSFLPIYQAEDDMAFLVYTEKIDRQQAVKGSLTTEDDSSGDDNSFSKSLANLMANIDKQNESFMHISYEAQYNKLEKIDQPAPPNEQLITPLPPTVTTVNADNNGIHTTSIINNQEPFSKINSKITSKDDKNAPTSTYQASSPGLPSFNAPNTTHKTLNARNHSTDQTNSVNIINNLPPESASINTNSTPVKNSNTTIKSNNDHHVDNKSSPATPPRKPTTTPSPTTKTTPISKSIHKSSPLRSPKENEDLIEYETEENHHSASSSSSTNIFIRFILATTTTSTPLPPPTEINVKIDLPWDELLQAVESALGIKKSYTIHSFILFDSEGDELSPPLKSGIKFWKFGTHCSSNDGNYFKVYIKESNDKNISINKNNINNNNNMNSNNNVNSKLIVTKPHFSESTSSSQSTSPTTSPTESTSTTTTTTTTISLPNNNNKDDKNTPTTSPSKIESPNNKVITTNNKVEDLPTIPIVCIQLFIHPFSMIIFEITPTLNCSWNDLIIIASIKLGLIYSQQCIQYFILVDNEGDELSPKLDSESKFWKFGSTYIIDNNFKFAVYLQENKVTPNDYLTMLTQNVSNALSTQLSAVIRVDIKLKTNSLTKVTVGILNNITSEDLLKLLASAFHTSHTKWIKYLSLEDRDGEELTGSLMTISSFCKLLTKNYFSSVDHVVVVHGEFIDSKIALTHQFFEACSSGDHLRIKSLLQDKDQEFHKNIALLRDSNNMSGLHLAAIHGFVEVISALLTTDIDIDSLDNNNMTALHYACDKKHIDIILFLANKGSNLVIKNKVGLTPLHFICLRGLLRAAMKLIHSDLVNLSNETGLTLLHCACDRGRLEIVQFLITHGAVVECRDTEGLTPLHYACLKGQFEIAKYLVEHGASANTRDLEGMSPLLYACSEGHAILAHWLLAIGASLNARNNAGNNALHLTADIGEIVLLKWLVDCGMDIHARNYDGLSPHNLATKMGHIEAATWLESVGAKDTPETDEEAHNRILKDKAVEALLRRNENDTSNKSNEDDEIEPLYENTVNKSTTATGVEKEVVDKNNHGKSIVTTNTNSEIDSALRDACLNGDLEEVKRYLDLSASIHGMNSNGSRPLHFACVSGHLEIAKLLIENGADMNLANVSGTTPLHFACDRRHPELALWLIDHGANLTVKCGEGYTPIHYICVRGLDDLLDTLSRRTDAFDANLVDNKNFSLLHCACEEGHLEVVRVLTRMNATIDVTDKRNRTPLHLACLRGHIAVAKCLLDYNADITMRDCDGSNSLLYACLGGNLELTKLLLSKGASLQTINNRGNTCLHVSCQIGNIEMATYLIESGIRIDTKNVDGHSAIDFAKERNHTDIAQLLEKKLREDNETNKKQSELSMAFYSACSSGDESIVSELLTNGVDPKISDENQMSGLHFASMAGNEEVVRVLLEAGADITVLDRYGMTPFHCACSGGHLSLAKYLIQQEGVNCNQTAADGSTALHLSVLNGHLKVIKWLVSIGCDIHAIKSDGCHVIHEACRGGHIAVVKFLVKKGVDITVCTTNGVNSLHIACELGYSELASWIHSEGIPVGTTDNFGRSPLIFACYNGHLKVAIWLAIHGASIHQKGGMADKLSNALHYACQNGHYEVAKWLYDEGIDMYAHNEAGETPVDLALQNDHIELAHWLIARGPIYLKDEFLKSSLFSSISELLAHTAFSEASEKLTVLFTDPERSNRIPKGTSPLHFAAVTDNFPFAQYLTRISHVDVNEEVTVLGMTPLHYAAYSSKLESIQFLVGQGGRLDLCNKAGDNALAIARRFNNLVAMKWLLDYSKSGRRGGLLSLNISPFACVSTTPAPPPSTSKGGTGPDSTTTKDTTVTSTTTNTTNGLLFACMPSPIQMVKSSEATSTDATTSANRLVEKNPSEINGSPLSDDVIELSEKLLNICETNSDTSVIRKLIEKGANINYTNPSTGCTPLHNAAMAGHLSLIQLLVEKGCKIDEKNIGGMTALHIACDRRHSDIALLLIKKGADLSARNKAGDTPLHKMCARGMATLIQHIIELPRSVLRVLDLDVKTEKGVSLLHCAVEHGFADVVQLLVSQSIQVNPRDEENRTPLHYASIKANFKIGEMLIASGAFVNARDNQGNTPLLCACVARHLPLAKLLVAHGANASSDNELGNNALHVACRTGDTEMAQWLVDVGVNPSVANNAGATAMQYASAGGFSELFEWLLAWTLAKSVGGTVEEVLAETRAASEHEFELEEEDDEQEDDEDYEEDG